MTVVRKPGICKPLEVLLRIRWPAVTEVRTLWIRAEIKPNNILAAVFSLEVNQAQAVADFLFLYIAWPVSHLRY
jgi:hypothetical protein